MTTRLNAGRHAPTPLALLALLALAAGCSKDKDVEQPAELVDFEPTLSVDRVWSASAGGGGGAMRAGLAPAIDNERIYAAGRGGDVLALQAADGRTAWRVRTKTELAGGPGVGAGLVVVGSLDGEVIALAAEDGRERWRVKLGGEVLSAPAVSAEIVVVRTVDGRLHGLSPAEGKSLWLRFHVAVTSTCNPLGAEAASCWQEIRESARVPESVEIKPPPCDAVFKGKTGMPGPALISLPAEVDLSSPKTLRYLPGAATCVESV